MIYRQPNFVWTADKDAELMGLVAEDRTFTFIARFMGLSPAAVSSRFKRLRDQMGDQAK